MGGLACFQPLHTGLAGQMQHVPMLSSAATYPFPATEAIPAPATLVHQLLLPLSQPGLLLARATESNGFIRLRTRYRTPATWRDTAIRSVRVVPTIRVSQPQCWAGAPTAFAASALDMILVTLCPRTRQVRQPRRRASTTVVPPPMNGSNTAFPFVSGSSV